MRVAVVLSQVIELERKVPIKLLCHPGVGAIPNPGREMGIVKKFITGKPVNIVPSQRMFDLEPMPGMDEIQPRLAPVILKPIAVAKCELFNWKFESCFQREPLLFTAHRRGGLVFKMRIEWEDGDVLS